MSVTVITGNIFTSTCQTLVNTINCVGVMGAGIALECRLRYPEMHRRYVELCHAKQINIGVLWLYRSHDHWILNFPTKTDWKFPSKIEYIRAGLDKFVSTFEAKGITSIAFPLLGADKGGIDPELSLNTMRKSLEGLPIHIEIYRYDPAANDDLYDSTKKWLMAQEPDFLVKETKLKRQYVNRVIEAMQSNELVQLNQLARVDGIGIKTLEKIFALAQSDLTKRDNDSCAQRSLIWPM